jgi:type I restriction enzyme S subunit
MREGWTRVAFGDVVRLTRERSSDPVADGFIRYVGLEHLDPGNLKIRRWGSTADGTTFTNVFRPGQVLFGKRRAYQRKVAVADFAGVCSGDIYVLEPKSDLLLPELLPFVCQSESFFEQAIRTSAGSLSPRTTWSGLAEYGFRLPPKDEQERILRLLDASRMSVEGLRASASAARELYRAVVASTLSRVVPRGNTPNLNPMPDGWTTATIESLVDPAAPVCYGIVQVGTHDPSGIPTLTIKDLRGDYIAGVHRASAVVEKPYARSRIRGGDVLLSIKAIVGEVGIVPDHFVGNISRDVARLRFAANTISPRFFYHLYRSPRYAAYVASRVVGSTRAELSIAAIKKLHVAFPLIAEQHRLVDRLDALEVCCSAHEARMEAASRLHRTMVDYSLDSMDPVQ